MGGGQTKLGAAHQRWRWHQQWQHNPAVPADKGIPAASSRQAMALVECCTSVTQNKRGAGIIRGVTLVRGTTKSKSNLNAFPEVITAGRLIAAPSIDGFQQLQSSTTQRCWQRCCQWWGPRGDVWPPDSSNNVLSYWWLRGTMAGHLKPVVMTGRIAQVSHFVISQELSVGRRQAVFGHTSHHYLI